MQRICLNMIVKNESAVIERCLRSVLPHVHAWCIVDTGSTDNTVEIINRVASEFGVPGVLMNSPWVNFGHNRTEALRFAEVTAKEHNCDFFLFLDADEQLGSDTAPALEAMPDLPEDWKSNTLVFVNTHFGATEYDRAFMASTDTEWIWHGALHEFLTTNPVEPTHKTARLPISVGLWVNTDGARSKDPEKFLKDARLLQAEYDQNPLNTRTCFYLAQSYMDAGQPDRAFEYYQARTKLKGWSDEVWYSTLRLGDLSAILNPESSLPAEYYLRALIMEPGRLESLVRLSEFYSARQQWEQAYDFANLAVSKIVRGQYKTHGLFIDTSAVWKSYQQHYLSLFYTGNKKEAVENAVRFIGLVKSGIVKAPDYLLGNIEANIKLMQ